MVNYFLFGFRNLRRRGIRSWLTLIGIFIGIAAVISLITLGSGLKAAIGAQFGISETQVITVQAGGLNSYGPPGSLVTNPLTRQDSEAIGKLSFVEYAIPRVIESIKMEFNDKLEIYNAVSVDEDEQSMNNIYEALDLKAEQGRLLKPGDTNRVVIGYDYSIKEKSGFDKAIKAGDKILIQDKKFEVIGILEKQGSLLMDKVVIMMNGELEDLAGYGDNVDIIAVKIKDRDSMDRAKEEIEKLLRKRRGVKVGEEDFEVQTPDAILASVNTILGGVQVFIVIIASISIIVGAIGIINTMTTSVLERKKEIGIMKAIGARNSNIFYQFLIESGMMGLAGGLIGVVFGMFIGFAGLIGINSFLGSELSLNMNYYLITSTLIGSFMVGAIAGIAPAMQAAKQNPVDALRGN